MQSDKTVRVAAEFFKELKGIRQPISETELAKAKNYIALSFPSEFETITDLTSSSRGDGGLQTARHVLLAVHRQRAGGDGGGGAEGGGDYVQPDKFAVVVVGDRRSNRTGHPTP